MLLFVPPIVQALIGVVILVLGVALHMYIVIGIGAVALAVGATRYVRSRRTTGLDR